MRNRSIKCTAIIVMMTSSITSCNKLIEIPPNPPDKIPESIQFADSTGIMSAWASIYNAFSPTSLNFYSGSVTISTGLASDELVTSPTGLSSDIALQNNNLKGMSSPMYGFWSVGYKNIFRINSCLQNIQGTTAISEMLKNQLIGEAKLVRAYTYLHLVNLFGGVPLITTTDYQVNKRLPRTSVDSIYIQIMSDLTDARSLLKNDYPSEGRARPNKMVANALLARVYLYRGQWKNAELAATDVITSGTYSLVSLPSIFLQGSNEAIWQLPSTGTFSQTAEGFNLVPASLTNSRVPAYQVSPLMLNSFEPGNADLRQAQWTAKKTILTTTYTYPAKYKQRTPGTNPPEDYVLLRLSEMYLIRAEALARQEKNTEAISDLNTIRNPLRVGLPVYNGPTTSAAVIAAILKERRIEFFCEGGHRWYDLKRTGTIDQVLGAEKTNWESTDALMPIPYSEITLNPFLKQNPSYE